MINWKKDWMSNFEIPFSLIVKLIFSLSKRWGRSEMKEASLEPKLIGIWSQVMVKLEISLRTNFRRVASPKSLRLACLLPTIFST